MEFSLRTRQVETSLRVGVGATDSVGESSTVSCSVYERQTIKMPSPTRDCRRTIVYLGDSRKVVTSEVILLEEVRDMVLLSFTPSVCLLYDSVVKVTGSFNLR